MIFLAFAYVIPTYDSIAIPIVSGVFWISIIISFILVSVKDPGYLSKHPMIDFQELLDTLDPLDICPEWEIILTPRWRHWNICNKCVERFDHHCPYINNWVGYNNHVYFLFYISSLGVNLAYQFILTIIAIAEHDSKGESLSENMRSVPMFYISSAIILLVTGSFVLPVLFLVFVHMTNFCKNKTTNERFSKQKINNTSLTNKMATSVSNVYVKRNRLLDSSDFNSFMGVQKRNCFTNCFYMWDYRPPSQLELHNEILRED